MSIRIVFPKPKLAKLLRAVGGLPVAEALEQAQANLDDLRPECLEELKALTGRIEACFARAPAGGDDPSTAELYELASGGVGLGAVAGLASVDETLVSLCRLVDHLQVRQTWDREALAVHVHTLKFLITATGATNESTQALLSGLARVNEHYKPPEDAPA